MPLIEAQLINLNYIYVNMTHIQFTQTENKSTKHSRDSYTAQPCERNFSRG